MTVADLYGITGSDSGIKVIMATPQMLFVDIKAKRIDYVLKLFELFSFWTITPDPQEGIMNRYILRYKGPTHPDYSALTAADCYGITEPEMGINILETTPTMLLIEADETVVKWIQTLSEWSITPETMAELPDNRQQADKQE
jgi:hypothetical protein